MAEHVKVLAALGIARALAALLIGGLLISKAGGLSLADYGSSREALEMESIDAGDREDLGFDQRAFVALGALCVAFAAIRTVQGIGVLRVVREQRVHRPGIAALPRLGEVDRRVLARRAGARAHDRAGSQRYGGEPTDGGQEAMRHAPAALGGDLVHGGPSQRS